MPITEAGALADHCQIYVKGDRDHNLAQRIVDAGAMQAERSLRRLLNSNPDDVDGDNDRYDELKDQGEGDTEYDRLQFAESLMAYHYALPRMNIRLTKKGGIVRATGNVQTANDLMSKAEMEDYRQDLYEDAVELLDELIEDEDLDDQVVYYT